MENKNIYALVTGGTKGIGRDVVNLLAEGGYNLIVTGASRDGLDTLAADVESRFPVTVHTYETDLTNHDDAFILHRDIEDQKMQVAIVAHSVHGQRTFEDFAQTGIDKQHETIQFNIMNFVVLTRLFLPNMIARHNGTLISAVEDTRTDHDMNAVYMASIAFLDSFMSSIRSELKGSGISVSNIRSSTVKKPQFRKGEKSNPRHPEKGAVRNQIYYERDGYESFMRDDNL